MNEKETTNAKISNVELGIEDHGFFNFWIHFEYGGLSQSTSILYKIEDIAPMIKMILEVLEKKCWEDLPTTPVRVIHDHSKVYELGNFLKDEWINLETKQRHGTG